MNRLSVRAQTNKMEKSTPSITNVPEASLSRVSNNKDENAESIPNEISAVGSQLPEALVTWDDCTSRLRITDYLIIDLWVCGSYWSAIFPF